MNGPMVSLGSWQIPHLDILECESQEHYHKFLKESWVSDGDRRPITSEEAMQHKITLLTTMGLCPTFPLVSETYKECMHV